MTSLIARDSTYEDIKSALVQENEEIRAVAKTANEGQSGRPINGPSDVLYLAIRNSVPDPNEAIFAMVNGKVVWVPNSDNAIDFAFQKSVQEDPGLIEPLMESLEHDLLPRDAGAAAAFGVRLHHFEPAVERALRDMEVQR